MRNRLGLLATIVGLLVASTAQAGHHLWDLTEAFSNADGTVQFVELFTAEDNEQGVGPFTMTSNGKTMNFVTNLPTAATANTWILAATSSFASEPGAVTPDYLIPDQFVSTSGGTIVYAGGADTWAHGAVPTDGLHSLLRSGSTGINSPTNFAGQTGSVNLAAGVPMVPTWGLIFVVGAVLFVASGLLRRREAPLA
jgi:hypothetical protein